MKDFACLCITSANFAHPGLAIDAAKAGGVGLIDLAFCQQPEIAERFIKKLLAATEESGEIGIRLLPQQLTSFQPALKALAQRSHWLMLAADDATDLPTSLDRLPAAAQRTVLVEVLSLQDRALQSAAQAAGRVHGLVARGNESGGWVSEESAFVLTQKLVAQQSLPVYVQGGIGPHSAAACRAAGAAGVVLDDQLLLMPSSPLSKQVKAQLEQLSGQETVVLGEEVGRTCRVLIRPGMKGAAALQTIAQEIEAKQASETSAGEVWPTLAAEKLGWDTAGERAWPLGQAVGLARLLRDRYKTVGRLVQAILATSADSIRLAQSLDPIAPNSPFARSHGTTYPVVQGPMTRVSDVAPFAKAIAQAGALPMLALALMQQPQVKALLEEANALMGDLPWGVGILGFVPPELRAAQLEVVRAVKPPFALIAGGRPDQAKALEAEGIATYLHAPTVSLLKMFLSQGAKRFVFEGRECGGHIGPLSSFVLWESVIDALLDVPAAQASDIHICFAGGIHDATSAAMISALVAPLAERGMKIGVLMGSAYTLTQEAVESGAVLPNWQTQILKSDRTANLITGAGHASRCALTPFVESFYQTRRQMLADGRHPDEIKDVLEDLTLGRLRIASKGLNRDERGQMQTVDAARQTEEGMYMIGQVATMHTQPLTLNALHEAVCVESARKLSDIPLPSVQEEQPPSPSKIAVVGLSTLLPRADNPEQYWNNIINQVDAITEIPADRWDWSLYYDTNKETRDKVYSRWGGFIDDVAFDPMRFGIPPKSLASIEPMQLLALEAVRRALADAGCEDGDFDREHTSVILGCGGGIGDLGQKYATRCELPRTIDNIPDDAWNRLPEWTEESFPGLLLNVIAGRVASRFDLGGSNFTVDAACASSLAAIDLAVRELESGRANVAIAGGVDAVQSPFAFMCFSKTQALTAGGRPRSFDEDADGIVISEGLAIVVMKRLEDAERDGDRIYGVIQSVGSSSDGKALGLTAPLPKGQQRALNRAYRKAQFSPDTVDLYEAHGTGTAVGDRAELETWTHTLTQAGASENSCAIGSVKTSIGHTKSTAGAAGLVKALLALYHKVLPPHRNVTTPMEKISEAKSPIYLLKEARPWLAPAEHKRRAAVSAFGFGGTNFHAVLEEYPSEHARTLGDRRWPHELFVFHGATRAALVKSLQGFAKKLPNLSEKDLPDLAYTYARMASASTTKTMGLSLVAGSLHELTTAVDMAVSALNNQRTAPLPPHIQFVEQASAADQKVAFVFSGQGSQYVEMAREVSLYFQPMRQALELADRVLDSHLPQSLSSYIYPPSAYTEADAEEQTKTLNNTQISQPALGAIELGFFELIQSLGLTPDAVAGHSYGEYGALHAAGVLSAEDFLYLSAVRGRVMAEACEKSAGTMAAIALPREQVKQHLQGVDGVAIANHNTPEQCVISGDTQQVTALVQKLKATGIRATLLPVSGAFHTLLVAPAAKPLSDAIAQVSVQPPKRPVYGNTHAVPYGQDPAEIRSLLSEHLVSPVEFVQQIENMYSSGTRIFVEIGPKQILSKLVERTLTKQPHLAVSLDGSGGLKGFLQAVGTLAINGTAINLLALYEHREVQMLTASPAANAAKKSPLTCWVNGGGVRLEMNKAQPAAATSATSVSASSSSKLPVSKLPNNEKATTMTANQFSAQSSAANTQTAPQISSDAVPQSDASVLVAYQAYQETMRQFLHLEEQVMGQLINRLQGGGAVAKPSEQSSETTATTSTATSIDRATLTQTIVKQISERISSTAPAPQSPTSQSPAPINNSYAPPQAAAIAPTETPVFATAAVSASPAPSSLQPQMQPAPAQAIAQTVAQPIAQTVAQTVAQTAMPVVNRTIVAPPAPQPVHQPIPQPAPTPVVPAPVPAPAPAATVPAPVPTPTPAPTPTGPGINREALTATLVELISERTGYPPEMLGADQDLEAELGVDSIKRVEILGALQSHLPDAIAQKLSDQMDALTRAKSINAAIAKVAEIAGGQSLGK